MKKIVIILFFVFISIFIIFTSTYNKNSNVIIVNSTYEYESDIMNVLVQEALEKSDQKNFKLINERLVLLPYDTKFHIIDGILNFRLKFLVYKRYLAAYELVNENNESIYVFFLIPENAVKKNLHAHQLTYVFEDAEKDGFYVLLVSNSVVIKELKSTEKPQKYDFIIKFKEEKEIKDNKILILLNYFREKFKKTT